MTRRRKVDWAMVDWSKQDIELSERLGVSRERVRQVRPFGVKPSEYRHRRGVTSTERIGVMDCSGKTVEEVARSAGCGAAYAGVALRKLKKDYRRLPRGNPRYDWGLLPENWKDLTDKALADIVGALNPAVVTQWRVRHGMRKRGC